MYPGVPSENARQQSLTTRNVNQSNTLNVTKFPRQSTSASKHVHDLLLPSRYAASQRRRMPYSFRVRLCCPRYGPSLYLLRRVLLQEQNLNIRSLNILSQNYFFIQSIDVDSHVN